MAGSTEDSIIEHLEQLGSEVETIAHRVHDIDQRLMSVEGSLADQLAMHGKANIKLDRIATRLGRIENRLGLSPPFEI